jgi:HAD superfamily hydrolase (TIGR01662 family)
VLRLVSKSVVGLRDIVALVPDIRALSFDLDKTVVGYHAEEVPVPVLDALRELVGSGIRIAVVSNAHGERVERVRRIAKAMGEAVGSTCESVVPADAGGRPKPNPAMFLTLATRLGLAPEACAHVGDQYFKDVVGAERAGFGATVLVAPQGEGDHPGVKWLQRPLEALIRPLMGYPARTDRFPASARVSRGR